MRQKTLKSPIDILRDSCEAGGHLLWVHRYPSSPVTMDIWPVASNTGRGVLHMPMFLLLLLPNDKSHLNFTNNIKYYYSNKSTNDAGNMAFAGVV